MQHRHGPPAPLLGGLNMVRALGLGGVRVIVASPDPDAPATRCKLPLSYSNDDYLSLVQENQAALARYFTLVLNKQWLSTAS